MSEPKAGEWWRRKSDGLLTCIIYVAPKGYFGGYVEHKAKRKTVTSLEGFAKKYEPVKEDE